MKTTYEIWKGKKPNISYFILNNDKDNLGKFDAKSDVGIFLGYSTTSKAYRVFNSHPREKKLLMMMKVHWRRMMTMAFKKA